VLQAFRYGNRVVTGIEDEHRYLAVFGQEPEKAADLGNGGVGGVSRRRDARRVERGGHESGSKLSWLTHW